MRGPHRPIRLLRVIPRYAPAWRYGGSVRFSYDLDTALVERGFRITVYTSDQIDEHHRSPDRHEFLHGIGIIHPLHPSGCAGIIRVLAVNHKVVASGPHAVHREVHAVDAGLPALPPQRQRHVGSAAAEIKRRLTKLRDGALKES